jgi:hypothetical protein
LNMIPSYARPSTFGTPRIGSRSPVRSGNVTHRPILDVSSSEEVPTRDPAGSTYC